MDKIAKALARLTDKEKRRIKIVLDKLACDNLSELDIKRLKGRNDIFRVRAVDIRIIYRKNNRGKVYVLSIARRNEKTYKF